MKFELINLQLLSTTVNDMVNTTSAGAQSGTVGEKSDMRHEIKEYYDRVLLEYAGPNLVHDQFSKKASIPAGNGKTIEWRRLVDLATNVSDLALTENVIPDGQEIDVENVEATISEFGGYIKLSDTLQIVAYDNLQTGFAKKLAEQAAKVSDKITREKMLTCTNILRAGGNNTFAAMDGDDKITLADVFKAAAQLAAVDAPTIDGSYVAIVHPYVAYDLMQQASNGWIDVMKYADPTKILNGEIGKIGNVRFVQSSVAKTYAANHAFPGSTEGQTDTATVGLCTTFFLGADAYASVDLAGGGIESITHDKHDIGGPLDQFSTMGWKLRKAVQILADRYMIRYYSATGAGTVQDN